MLKRTTFVTLDLKFSQSGPHMRVRTIGGIICVGGWWICKWTTYA